MPKISVIVPVYNTEKYLRKCLDSIVNQSYPDIEIIIVNDGSTDNSQIIIDEYKEKYPCIISYYIDNSGVAIARNYGVEKVSGDYFLFVDSDDYIEKYLCEKLVQNLTEELDIIKYKMQIINRKNKTKIDGPVFSKTTGEKAFNVLCFSDKIIDTPCLYLFNTKFFKKNKFKFMENTYHEDFGLIPLVIVKAKKVVSLNLFCYNYVFIENSITRNNDYTKTLKKANDILKHYDNMCTVISCMSINKFTIDNIKQYYTHAIFSSMQTLKNSDLKLYKHEIKKRKLVNNIKIKNIRSLLKKISYYIKAYL